MNGNLVVLNNRREIEKKIGRPLSALASTILDFDELREVAELGAIGAIHVPIAVLPEIFVEIEGVARRISIPIAILNSSTVSSLIQCVESLSKKEPLRVNDFVKSAKMCLDRDRLCIELSAPSMDELAKLIHLAALTFMGTVEDLSAAKIVICFERHYLRTVFIEELCSIIGEELDRVENCVYTYLRTVTALGAACFRDIRSSRDRG